jgi:hypothetical protein
VLLWGDVRDGRGPAPARARGTRRGRVASHSSVGCTSLPAVADRRHERSRAPRSSGRVGGPSRVSTARASPGHG